MSTFEGHGKDQMNPTTFATGQHFRGGGYSDYLHCRLICKGRIWETTLHPQEAG